MVYLERRVPGKFGRLEAMNVIIPTRKRLKGTDKFFGSARYRQSMWKMIHGVMDQAGVPEKQKLEFYTAVFTIYPNPTAEEIFLEDLEGPWLKAALGDRKKELSYFKTGKPEITAEDKKLIQDGLDKAFEEMRKGPDGFKKVAEFISKGPYEIGL